MAGVRNEGLLLIIDDDDLRRYTKSRILRNAGFEVIEAASGTEGLLLIRDRRPRLAVIDVGLPDMTGHEVSRRIKSDPELSSMPVLQISATFVTEADTVASLDSGADASLLEPMEPQVLVATVRALLRARQADEAMREALAREQAARNSAEEANRVKDDFLAVLSHELRSPLGAILSWATLLRSGTLDEARREQGLAAIERNANLQRKLIEDLLDVSRIISGKSVLDIGRVEVGPAIDAAMETMRAATEAKGVRMDAVVDPTVGPLRADATRFQQILWNLLSNAVKFTPKGGSVRIEVGRTDSQAVIRVIDTGKGIPAQFLPHVFERFRQADSSTTRSEGGLGLGLAIVRHIVEQHGGTVRADSAGEGMGAEFTVQLPLPEPAGDNAAREGADGRGGRGTTGAPGESRGGAAKRGAATFAADRLEGLRVLVVDDETDTREAVVGLLESCGATVVGVDGVPPAQRAMRSEPFDVVVSDIGMPGEDGYALMRWMRARESTAVVPVLALSAYANAAEVRRTREAGFDATLAKPVDASALIAEVSRLAGRSKVADR
jgi:signal transduction histidine kinase